MSLQKRHNSIQARYVFIAKTITCYIL